MLTKGGPNKLSTITTGTGHMETACPVAQWSAPNQSQESLTRHDNTTRTRPEVTKRNPKPTRTEPISTRAELISTRSQHDQTVQHENMLFFNLRQIQAIFNTDTKLTRLLNRSTQPDLFPSSNYCRHWFFGIQIIQPYPTIFTLRERLLFCQ